MGCVSVEVKVGKLVGVDLEERLIKNFKCFSIKDGGEGFRGEIKIRVNNEL